ncbi:MAG: sensor histidine kinase [Dehalococcoidia bacterium]|nr:MAG: sensor histidine kinase [Dehalococcoidia bacterium]
MIRRARLRLTLWYSGALLLLLLIFSTVTYTAVTRTLRHELENGVSRAVTQWLEAPRRLPLTRPAEGRGPGLGPGRPGVTPTPETTAATDATPRPTLTPRANAPHPDPRMLPLLDDTTVNDPGSTSDVFFLAFRADGELAVNPRRIDAEEIANSDALHAALKGQPSWETIEDDGVRLRIFASPIVVGGHTEGAIVGARNLDEYDRQIRAVVIVLAMVAGGGGLLSLGGAYLFAGHALQPLEDAYDRQRSFVADASHELRSPLAVIRASADLLLREPLPAPHRESVEEIRDVTQEAATLIDDLLELARAEEGTPDHAESETAVEINAVIGQMRSVLDRRGHTVSTVLTPVKAAAEGAEIRRIVRALIENVMAHTPEGTPVRVELSERGGNAVLAVEDSGPGIPDGHEDTIFERFARLDEARTPGTGHGAGLGLAIVRSLAERRGGSVSASRPASGGLRVEVSFPLAK